MRAHAPRRHRRERGRRRHRRRLGGHLQGREPQPPVATSSRTRARRPASAASSATSSRWAPGPIAVMDPLRFGALDHPDTARVVPGVVAGVGGYGNCLGLPNIGGEVVLRPLLPGQPARQRAVRRASCGTRTSTSRTPPAPATSSCSSAPAPAATASAARRSSRARPSTRAVRRSGPRSRSATRSPRRCSSSAASSCSPPGSSTGIQDLGAAGLSCAFSELASNGDGGMLVRLDDVPLRDPSLRPEEILMSESQERMMAVVRAGRPRHVPVDHRRSGTSRRPWSARSPTPGGSSCTGTARRSSTCRRARSRTRARSTTGRTPAPRGSTHGRPTSPTGCRGRRPTTSCARLVLRLVASPNLCSRAWVTDQYDRYVLGNTALAMPDDAGVIRVDEEIGPRGRHRDRRQRPVRRARPLRRRPAGAGRGLPQRRDRRAPGPLAVTDCLNFGSPEDPDVDVAVRARRHRPRRRAASSSASR